MTFKGDRIIGKPLLSQIEIYIADKGLFCEAKDVYDYWENKSWLTSKHQEIATLESAINCYNSIAVNKATKRVAKELGITKLGKKKKKQELKALRKTIDSKGLLGIESQLKKESFGLDDKKKKTKKKSISYTEQLNDKRWEAFRRFVLVVRGNKCEMCGGTKILQIHHSKYKSGHLAWEYTCNEVMVVCKDCHEKIHGIVTITK